MKIIITENQHKMLLESVVSDVEFRNLIKGYESTVVNSKNQHYVFDDKDPKLPPNNKKTFIRKKSPYGGVLTIGWGHTGPSVKPGETLSGIASKYDKTVTVDSIIKLNDLKSATLKPGQILKLK